MDNHSHSQLELFSQATKYKASRDRPSRSFLNRIWAYEKVILVTMAVIIIGLVSFSMGVAKGKKSALKKDFRFDTVNKKNQPVEYRPTDSVLSQSQLVPEAKSKTTLEKPKTVVPRKPEDSLQEYAIQLASYKNRSSAQREAEALNKRGFSALVVRKGEYLVLLVSGFSDKKTARATLSQLEKRYHGCFIRRM